MARCRRTTSRWNRLCGNPLYPEQQTNPPADKKERPDNPYANSPDDPRFPYVLTTYRLTEHHTAGGMTRSLSHLAELQPELFAEISPELAQASRSRAERLGHHRHAARDRLSARAGHRAHAAVWDRMARPFTRSACLITGAKGHGHRRRRQRSARHLRGAQRAHHGNQGAGVQSRARAAQRGQGCAEATGSIAEERS